jgi:hypothetical protein
MQQPLEAAALGEPRTVEDILVDLMASLPRAGAAHGHGLLGHGARTGHNTIISASAVQLKTEQPRYGFKPIPIVHPSRGYDLGP